MKQPPQVLATINAHLAEHGLLLRTGTVVDATIIAAPSSTKNKDGARDPEMHQTKKGNQWHFGMRAHIGVDAESGLVHTVTRSRTAIFVHRVRNGPGPQGALDFREVDAAQHASACDAHVECRAEQCHVRLARQAQAHRRGRMQGLAGIRPKLPAPYTKYKAASASSASRESPHACHRLPLQ